MTARRSILRSVSIMLVLIPVPSPAHHALDEAYARDSSIVLTGTVTRVDWVNPHVILRLSIQDTEDSAAEWLVEMDAPHALRRRGWTRDSIAAGQVVTVEGFRALDDSRRTEAKTITLPGGEALVASTDGSWNWRSVL